MSARTVVSLEESWLFQADTENQGMELLWYEQGPPSGEMVKIPHTWNVQNGLEEFRGTGWYSHDFYAPLGWKGKLLRLQFDAVYRDAVVWVNGKRVGEHTQSGYTPFIIEISDTVTFDAINRIVVSVNNENSQTALPMGNSFDWADDGGIIRGVSLLVSGRTAIDYSKLQAVPYFTDDMVGTGAPYGILSGEICLWEQARESECKSIKLKVMISSEKDFLTSNEWEMSGDEGVLSFQDIKVEHLKLWHFDHPHLYNVTIALYLDGVLTDEVCTAVGFREIRTEGNTLLLNREPVRLMGVEWMPGSNPMSGMAESVAQLEEMLHHMKHANCVITRFHWQQDSKLLEWCDRNGLLVQEEIPHWQTPQDPDDEWLNISMQHAQEMIHRHYNHPCIYAWGIGNEVNGQSTVTVRYFEELKSLVHGLDDTRFINYVSNTVHESPAQDATGVGDMVMWNDYIGTWHGELDRPEVIQNMTRGLPNKPLVVAEYGLCEPAFEGGDERRTQILVDNTREYRKHPAIAALIYFSLNDYRTQMGEEGEGRLRQRVHGSISLDGTPKPSYEALRQLASPINLNVELEKEKAQVVVIVENRNDIPCYRISGYILKLVDQLGDCITEHIPDLSPGEKHVFYFTDIPENRWNELVLDIIRPTGSSVSSDSLMSYT
ncbi:glycoside hydrolase family 2 TIM barrel-domain containing protein [Paenibacillus sp. 2003]|uniref:glycoside hydrolase family 2 protein n=1 Tax=Paenibacillus TaxID=44249 RepID=UPI00285E765C|nr:glycoside hydrolase family 2 TIM barrel-domain containing protein [Paenibacillus sp. 2003]MDR6716987.1 beta-glucuronidase [Paenibacillus sp. 2003]